MAGKRCCEGGKKRLELYTRMNLFSRNKGIAWGAMGHLLTFLLHTPPDPSLVVSIIGKRTALPLKVFNMEHSSAEPNIFHDLMAARPLPRGFNHGISPR